MPPVDKMGACKGRFWIGSSSVENQCDEGALDFRGPDERRDIGIGLKNIGSVVQLVRMPPCHGGGRGFESRPVRKKASKKFEALSF